MTEADTSTTTFDDLGLQPQLLTTLVELGYEEPTPIQREALPPLLAGRDLMGQAATGTGKTAAFALPLLQALDGPRAERHPAALVLVPTRELAMQVSEAIHRYGSRLGARVLPVYGGAPLYRQVRALEAGVDVVVATPGRAVDLVNRGSLHLRSVSTVVLDEADEMLDMGFADDLEALLEQTPRARQTVLFSATLPARIDRLARSHLRDPVRVALGHKATGEKPLLRQVVYTVPRAYKAVALGRLLDVEAPTAAIVFCRTRDEVDTLTASLNGRGYRSEALHGGLTQEQRDKVMARLRSGATELLVATDVAARGLDVDLLTHVVNYDVPASPETYLHRVGRVGRAGRTGVAITLAEPREHRMVATIERATGVRMTRESVPTVADLRARRLELTTASLREALLAGAHDRFRVVVESLTDEFDLMDVVQAAVQLAHEATGVDDEYDTEIPVAAEPVPRRSSAGPGAARPSRIADGARIFVGLGRSAGIRPNDLVGAIAGESSLRGRDVGGIEIFDAFSLVEVPEGSVDEGRGDRGPASHHPARTPAHRATRPRAAPLTPSSAAWAARTHPAGVSVRTRDDEHPPRPRPEGLSHARPTSDPRRPPRRGGGRLRLRAAGGRVCRRRRVVDALRVGVARPAAPGVVGAADGYDARPGPGDRRFLDRPGGLRGRPGDLPRRRRRRAVLQRLVVPDLPAGRRQPGRRGSAPRPHRGECRLRLERLASPAVRRDGAAHLRARRRGRAAAGEVHRVADRRRDRGRHRMTSARRTRPCRGDIPTGVEQPCSS